MIPPIERFPPSELADLRQDLLQSGLDHWQAAELLAAFLAVRGYGVSSLEARIAASRIESRGCSLLCLQKELTQLAFTM